MSFRIRVAAESDPVSSESAVADGLALSPGVPVKYLDAVAWNPRLGTVALAHRLGKGPTRRALIELLSGSVMGPDLAHSPWREVLVDIGDGHAVRLLHDPSGARLLYWPRAWAARSMAYLGDEGAGAALEAALADEHWRVRMNSASALGRLGIAGATGSLRRALGDPNPRVRQAAVLAIQRVGDESALGDLTRLLPHSDAPTARRIEAAIDAIEHRS